MDLDLTQPYLSSQLIAYIGNKRSLLPFLYQTIGAVTGGSFEGIFLDAFAGSGAVARLAKMLGFRVYANDWEPYAYAINSCHIGLDLDDLSGAFHDRGGVEKAFAEINADGPVVEPYISRHYSPRKTTDADYKKERMFYTRENGLFIDRVRERIEAWYPDADSVERRLLLASLTYQAATHANTNGVFKAFHRGFGGFGRDALSRIMRSMELQIPILINGETCGVGCEDAAVFVRRHSADICYLDPPYNQHQYGSNYHLLNTIVAWDKPPVDNSHGDDGRLKHKAGIRRDWVKTKSPFCYRNTAPTAMSDLLDGIDAGTIIISYNTEGIIPFWQLFELLAETGSVEIRTSDYIVYRGGKQSISRSLYNQEFLFILDRRRPFDPASRKRARRFLLTREIAAMQKAAYHPDRIARRLGVSGSNLGYRFADGTEIRVRSRFGYDLTFDTEALADLSEEKLDHFLDVLQFCAVVDKREEAMVLLKLLVNDAGANQRALQRRLVRTVKKFAFKKYREEYEQTISAIRSAAAEMANLETKGGLPAVGTEFLASLEEVDRIARLRFES